MRPPQFNCQHRRGVGRGEGEEESTCSKNIIYQDTEEGVAKEIQAQEKGKKQKR
jgi:hypothetical protein